MVYFNYFIYNRTYVEGFIHFKVITSLKLFRSILCYNYFIF